MTYKTILAILNSPKNAAQITDFAMFLARQSDAHVIGLHAETLTAIPLVAPMEIPDPAAIEALQDLARAETDDIERIFRERTAREGVSAEWRSLMSSVGFGSGGTVDSARSVDLIVAGQGDPDVTADSRADFEGFLFESGRPVLLVPYVLKKPKPVERVLVAWNGSREAARATFDALPFLKAAAEVEILTADSDDADASTIVAGAEIAATLARHGVKVTVISENTHGKAASAIIENRLSNNSIDLLVMGAYSHSRLWEFLFGGVTRTLLSSMTALTLLSR